MPYVNKLPILTSVSSGTYFVAVDNQVALRVPLNTVVSSITSSSVRGPTGPMGPFGPVGPSGPSGPRGIPGLVKTTTVPTSSTSTGVVGTFAISENYMYLCVDTNSWVKLALTSF
jgi:hypothetical protein